MIWRRKVEWFCIHSTVFFDDLECCEHEPNIVHIRNNFHANGQFENNCMGHGQFHVCLCKCNAILCHSNKISYLNILFF
jgi:hypothetical protein